MREGGCKCGAIRYCVMGEPLAAGICHCETCRRVASAPGLPFAVFPVARFALLRGIPASFNSSPGVTRRFCGQCGSPLTYQDSRQPEQLDIMICSLDDVDALAPAFHVWTSERVIWDETTDRLPSYAKARG